MADTGMSVRKVDLHDVLFGGFLILVAAGALIATRKLTVGTAANMGPGYMPLAISLGLMAFGVFFTGRGLFRPYRGIEPVQLRPLLAIIVSVAIFALLAERFGLVVAAMATVIVAGFGGREHRFVEGLIFAAVLTGCAVLLFARVLSMPIPVWPW